MSTAMRSAAAASPSPQLEGSFVTTIEGLSRDRSHPVQQAFAADMVPQCGYCIPGMIMAASALIDRNDSPTDAQIDAAVTNICRCGIYPRLRESIRRAVRIKTGREQVARRAAARHRAGGRGARSAGDPRPARAAESARIAARPLISFGMLSARFSNRSSDLVHSPSINRADSPPDSEGVFRCERH